VARPAAPPAFKSRRGHLPTHQRDTDDTPAPTLQKLIDELEAAELQRRKYTRSTTTGDTVE